MSFLISLDRLVDYLKSIFLVLIFFLLVQNLFKWMQGIGNTRTRRSVRARRGALYVLFVFLYTSSSQFLSYSPGPGRVLFAL